MSISKFLIRYKYSLILFLILILLFFFNNEFGIYAFENVKSIILQMLSILPPVMLLLGLMDEWIPREYFMKYMGDSSKILGILLSFAFAFFGAGPMYAGFPFVAVLMKKGVKFSNIIIFLNAWCVTKFSTLLFEVGSLGYKFTLCRLIINIPGVIIMGYLVDYLVNKKPHKI
ncbi:permease [Romboutsia sp. 13368]|uniref:permease n=1 Tax=Romboutsia sp. 13368 TaxID=2708053 RepID=UPI0025D9E614|nr:permease [Romboutsia sp. 13368]